MENIRISGIEKESIVDGPGIRYVIFVQGCPHHCPGCHNPQTHDFDGGKDKRFEEILSDLDRNPLLSGVTFSGGEPFCKAKELLELAKEIRKKCLNIVCYSGYTFEELLEKGKREPEIIELLKLSDLLIDGKFILEEKSLMLKFRGSKNQRILNLPASLEAGEAVLAEI